MLRLPKNDLEFVARSGVEAKRISSRCYRLVLLSVILISIDVHLEDFVFSGIKISINNAHFLATVISVLVFANYLFLVGTLAINYPFTWFSNATRVRAVIYNLARYRRTTLLGLDRNRIIAIKKTARLLIKFGTVTYLLYGILPLTVSILVILLSLLKMI